MQLNGNFKYIRGIRSSHHYTQNSTLYSICYGFVFTFGSFIFKRLKKKPSIFSYSGGPILNTSLGHKFFISPYYSEDFFLYPRNHWVDWYCRKYPVVKLKGMFFTSLQIWHRVSQNFLRFPKVPVRIRMKKVEEKDQRAASNLIIQAISWTVGNSVLKVCFAVLLQTN